MLNWFLFALVATDDTYLSFENLQEIVSKHCKIKEPCVRCSEENLLFMCKHWDRLWFQHRRFSQLSYSSASSCCTAIEVFCLHVADRCKLLCGYCGVLPTCRWSMQVAVRLLWCSAYMSLIGASCCTAIVVFCLHVADWCLWRWSKQLPIGVWSNERVKEAVFEWNIGLKRKWIGTKSVDWTIIHSTNHL